MSDGVLSKPFDREARIEAKGFGHVRLRLVHLAQERVGGREAQVGPLRVIAGVERLVVFDDRGFGMPRPNSNVPTVLTESPPRIIRAQPNRLLHVGFCLVEAAQGYFRVCSSLVEIRKVRIDCEAGVGDTDCLVKTARQRQVKALRRIRSVGNPERARSRGLTDQVFWRRNRSRDFPIRRELAQDMLLATP